MPFFSPLLLALRSFRQRRPSPQPTSTSIQDSLRLRLIRYPHAVFIHLALFFFAPVVKTRHFREVVEGTLERREEPLEALGEGDPGEGAGVVGDAYIGVHEDPVVRVEGLGGGEGWESEDIGVDEAAFGGVPEGLWLGSETEGKFGGFSDL